MQKTVIIIGAGIAGLAAGCYARMNGYRAVIFELHNIPGGLCTSWRRKGYLFDGAIHYLFGSAEGQPFNRLWQELGAVQGRAMINHEEFLRVVAPDGRTLIAYSDPDRLEAHMRALAPEDAEPIADLAEGIRQFEPFDMSLLNQTPRALMDAQDWQAFGQKMAPFLIPMAKWASLSASEFAQRFSDPFLRSAVAHMFGWPDIPMMAALSVMAYAATGNAAFPAGGSLEFARAIEQRFLALGGEIHYNAQVHKILVENERAVGVRLYNDEIYAADFVISAADGRATIFEMLEGAYTNATLRKLYDGHLPLHSMVQISLGVSRDLSAEPHWAVHLLERPVLMGGTLYTEFPVKHYCYDRSMAPVGKSSIVLTLRSDYSYWQRIYGRRLYDSEQEQMAGIAQDLLERYYPGLRAQTEVVDVATPVSYERYTGNWEGSSCGFLMTTDAMTLMIQGMPKTLPRLENFYMAGQWVEPGGSVPLAGMSGRNAVQLMCAQDGRPFETQIP